MDPQSVNNQLEPHFRILRQVLSGAGDREIIEAKKAVSAVVVLFPFPSVQAYARRSQAEFDRALKYVDCVKKNEAACEGAQYFLDRAYLAVVEGMDSAAKG